MKFLQKLGKALMLPVACLPICGILMGIGYALCPATMQGGDITGIGNQIGFFLVKAGGALIDNMALLFVIGVGVGMAEKHDGTGGLAALASWLMITNLLSTAVVTTIMPSIAKNADATLAFDKISNPFIGILAGVIGSMCYNKFKDTKLPDWLSFFHKIQPDVLDKFWRYLSSYLIIPVPLNNFDKISPDTTLVPDNSWSLRSTTPSSISDYSS